MRGTVQPIPDGSYRLFDAIRTFAAFAVVIGHARNLLLLDSSPGMSIPAKAIYFLTGFGHQAVMIFFVISGFWITRAVVRRHDGGGWSWRGYLFDRVTRLWVVLVPALVIGGAMDFYGRFVLEAPVYLGTQGANVIAGDIAPSLTPEAFLGNLAFLQTMMVPTFGSNGPLWSLANEFWYYIWFPALFGLIRVRKGWGVILPLVIGLLVALYWPHLIFGFVCWLFGALVFFAAERWPRPRLPAGKLVAAGTAGLFLATLAFSRIAPGHLGQVMDLAITATISLALYAAMISGIELPRILKPLADFGGKSSYSLYVIHFPLLALIAALLVPAQRIAPDLKGLAVLAAVIAGAVLWGWVFSLATEHQTGKVRGLLRWRKR